MDMANIDLGVDVVGSDGEKLGVVDSLVIDPKSGEVHSLVLRKGLFFPTDTIVPMTAVLSVEARRIRVNFSKESASELPEYLDSAYIPPPAGYYGMPGVYWPATEVYAADSSLIVDDQIHAKDPGTIILSEGTLVIDKDGQDVGRITELATDERGRVSGFRVEEGLFRHHDRFIPASFIVSADDAVVRLSTRKADIEELHDRR